MLTLGIKIAGALETAHRLGTLHRDVKPANILLTDFGEPQLSDFGIARVAGGFETSSGTITGTPAFTAPVLLAGEPPTAASDVYSLAATMFCAMTGHAAFERRSGENVAHFVRISRQPTPQLRDGAIPDDVAAALEHAMARDPTDRPQSAAGFGAELQGIERQHRLLEAIQYVVPDLAGELGETLEEHGGAAAEYVLSSLIDGIEARGEPVTTVLDDWHRIHDRAAIAIMAYLLDNACDELTFVVTSRTRSGLPLGRMRVQRRTRRNRLDRFAFFDCDEARRFLRGVAEPRLLDRRDVDRLCESTNSVGRRAAERASLSLSSGPEPGRADR